MPLLLPFSCIDGAIWRNPTEPVYKRTLQNKDSHGQNFAGRFSIFTWRSWEEIKHSEIASWDSSVGRVTSREGSHGYLDVWWPQKKHLVFKQRLDQTFFIQANIPLHNSQKWQLPKCSACREQHYLSPAPEKQAQALCFP